MYLILSYKKELVEYIYIYMYAKKGLSVSWFSFNSIFVDIFIALIKKKSINLYTLVCKNFFYSYFKLKN